jgi:RNase H-fold protein (predicted Holliday junction resolvase)
VTPAATIRSNAVVVGLPRRLTGEDTDQTAPTRQFAAALADLAGRPRPFAGRTD